jgi:hypothetical protein
MPVIRRIPPAFRIDHCLDCRIIFVPNMILAGNGATTRAGRPKTRADRTGAATRTATLLRLPGSQQSRLWSSDFSYNSQDKQAEAGLSRLQFRFPAHHEPP